VKLHLESYTPLNLSYLQSGDTRQDDVEDAARFQAWKACLGKSLSLLSFKVQGLVLNILYKGLVFKFNDPTLYQLKS
jgi:hypothetical protein